MTHPPLLVSDEVSLRAFRPGDAQGLAEYRNDPTTRSSVGRTRPYTLEQAHRFLARVGDAGADQCLWAVDVGGAFVGSVELTTFGRGFSYGAVKLGYGIHPALRGRGFATAACRLALGHAVSRGCRTVVWQAVAGNDASLRVARRLGFDHFTHVPGLLPFETGLTDGWHAVLDLTGGVAWGNDGSGSDSAIQSGGDGVGSDSVDPAEGNSPV